MKKKSVLIICGPTATGKTALAVYLAKKFEGELVSADSRQVYKGMDIGTGKDYVELEGIPIWMYDVVNPDEEFSVSAYRALAQKAIANIHKRNKLPIVVGGSGLYIKAIVDRLDTLSIPPNIELRKKLKYATVSELQSYLHQGILSEMNNSDKNNPRRLIRKIEIINSRAKIIHSSVSYNTFTIGLMATRSEIEKRIEIRISKRIQQGALLEFETLEKKYGRIQALQAPGYKSVETWKQDELAYAKRQMTWFKKNQEIRWYDISDQQLFKKVEDHVDAWYTTKE